MRTTRTTAFLACAVMVACSRSDKSVTEEPLGTATITSSPVTITGLSDEELIRRAEAAIAANPKLSMLAGDVEIDVIDGVATLRGAAPDAATIRGIEDAVARVPGIVTTLNKAELRTPSPEEIDDTIAFSLQRALVTDPAVAQEAERVSIDVKNGSVTLRGTVEDDQVRAAVERIASRTPGIVVVQNHVRVNLEL